jgi:hydroxymethylpyrimidine/phosphomethylpyrimidine kinase
MGRTSHPLLLIVSGHDPSGAGVDADLEAAEGTGVESIAVVTARTDQDSSKVRSIGARSPEEWGREAARAAVAGAGAVKFGLLPGAAHVRRARALVEEMRRATASSTAVLRAVVDPVICASCGSRFLDKEAVEALRGELAAAGVVLTPNLAEAAELACLPRAELESSFAARLEAARILLALGAAGVVVKGGHGREDPVRDLVARADGTHRWIERPRRAGAGIRGSGCRFATRLAVGLALGRELSEAAREAGEFVAAEIARAAGASGRS